MLILFTLCKTNVKIKLIHNFPKIFMRKHTSWIKYFLRLETTSGLWKNLKVPVIVLLSRLFQQIVTRLQEKNFIYFFFNLDEH